MKIKFVHKVALFAMSCLLVVGCSSGPGKETVKERYSLKVMFGFWNESYFNEKYGELFAMKYPNIDIEVVSQPQYSQGVTDYEKVFNDFIEKEQPDVVVLDTSKFITFISDGKLVELDSLIARDKYNTETIYPGVLDLLREQGGGKLYGMAPSFSENVILYNADLFKKYGVDLPHDGMTWQNIIDTARRFPTDGDDETRIYGYGSQGTLNVDTIAQEIANTEGLRAINPETMKITINTDSWKKAYQLALDVVNSGAAYNPKAGGVVGGTIEDYYKSQLFLTGRMAITTGNSSMLQTIQEASTQIRDYKPFELGMVAGPVDPAEPDATREVNFDGIFGIRANSPNLDAAWEFLKFVNGEEFARVKSKDITNGLMSRMGFSKEYNGHSLDVFYKLKPNPKTSFEMYKIPAGFYDLYQPIVDRELALVQDNKKAISDALATIQDEGQVILDKVMKDAEAN